jgi:hypothetical protein
MATSPTLFSIVIALLAGMVLSMVLNYSKKGSFGVWEMAKRLESGETIGLTEWVI